MLVVSGSFLGMTFQDISHLIILLVLMISVEAGDVKPVGLRPFIRISSSNQMMFLGVTFPEAPTGISRTPGLPKCFMHCEEVFGRLGDLVFKISG